MLTLARHERHRPEHNHKNGMSLRERNGQRERHDVQNKRVLGGRVSLAGAATAVGCDALLLEDSVRWIWWRT